jgi:hypothetical protein
MTEMGGTTMTGVRNISSMTETEDAMK